MTDNGGHSFTEGMDPVHIPGPAKPTTMKTTDELIKIAECGNDDDANAAMKELKKIDPTYHWCPDWDYMVINRQSIEALHCSVLSKTLRKTKTIDELVAKIWNIVSDFDHHCRTMDNPNGIREEGAKAEDAIRTLIEQNRDEFAEGFLLWWRQNTRENNKDYVYGKMTMKQKLEQFKQTLKK